VRCKARGREGARGCRNKGGRSQVPRVILDICPTPISVGRYRFVSAVRFPPPSRLESTPTQCRQNKKVSYPYPRLSYALPCRKVPRVVLRVTLGSKGVCVSEYDSRRERDSSLVPRVSLIPTPHTNKHRPTRESKAVPIGEV
jgi:hypothetical protein